MYIRHLLLLLIAGIFGIFPATASVVITGTRVVYPLNAKDVSVRLNNNGTFPSLVQAWIDDGHASASPESMAVPFVLSPPVFRINPAHSQTLRLVYTGEDKPVLDRESVYWLNVLEIPPKPDASAGENTLQFAVRSRIKLFLRPGDLAGNPVSAPAQVTWRLVREGDTLKLVGYNPTPFHVSLAAVELMASNGALGKPMVGMLSPRSEQVFALQGTYPEGQSATSVKYTFVNDFGGFIEGVADLSVAP